MKMATGKITLWSTVQVFAVALALLGGASAVADVDTAGSAAVIHARYAVLRDQLSGNQFQKPLHLDSAETGDNVRGDIHALINYPFAAVSAALNRPENWCDIMMLHLNTKYCRGSTVQQRDILNVGIGRKHDQPIEDVSQVAFAWRVVAQTPNYLQVSLNADEGPLSTRDYRFMLEAVPLDNGQTFMRLSYSYGYGVVGRLAMQTYLATIGSNKVGFTIIGKQSGSQPVYVGGMRGLVERNTMRYYLAIEAFLGALSVPPQARLEKRLHDWFAANERYPRQLHEMEQGEYLNMKRKEYMRQRGGAKLKLQGQLLGGPSHIDYAEVGRADGNLAGYRGASEGGDDAIAARR